MPSKKVHIINHTHWDREWFLTATYTSPWIPRLIDRLAVLAQANPDFRFLLDGQTLVIEDLLRVAPEYQARVEHLAGQNNLTIGPYYCQPDWKLAGGELLIRNLQHGLQDARRFDGQHLTGWLVDTFGHISQAPQIHRLFGIQDVFVWRGVPLLEPYFRWQGADGQHVFAVNLFGGYRNLYGVTHAPEVAVQRLKTEYQRLAPYYPTPDVPLFDGYDLEDNPEDPLSFYREQTTLPEDLDILETTPAQFAEMMRHTLPDVPRIHGELNSGKYGATFTGTYSARVYLKLMSWDCSQLIYHWCEPLAVMAHLHGAPYDAAQYERWSRSLLQNAVHDCICGVSIDQVHEKMAATYRDIFEATRYDAQRSLAAILKDFRPGTYAISTTPYAYEGWLAADGQLYHVQTDGVGVWPVDAPQPLTAPQTPVRDFEWQNDHYTARVDGTGQVYVDGARLGTLVVSAEAGDTYTDERGVSLGSLQPEGPPVLAQQGDGYAALRYTAVFEQEGVQVGASVRLIFDQSPLIQWQVTLDSRGTDFQVEMVFETGRRGQVRAGMPFDVVARPFQLDDLLPQQLTGDLADILLGQREVGRVQTFPFHERLHVLDDDGTTTILARGIYAYQANPDGRLAVTLRRAVEWLTRTNLQGRVGDAGPLFYVPDARCERTETHELAVFISPHSPDEAAHRRWCAGYTNPPRLVKTTGGGQAQQWQLLRENLPLSSLQLLDGHILARVYNPTGQTIPLSQPYQTTDVWGQPGDTQDEVAPGSIVNLRLAEDAPLHNGINPGQPAVHFLTPFTWRVGDNQDLPDPAIISELGQRVTALEVQLAEIDAQLAEASGTERYLLQHRYYVLKREMLEFQLSRRLNQEKLARRNTLGYDDLYAVDKEIAALGLQLNQLRIKRRIYDYIVQAVQNQGDGE